MKTNFWNFHSSLGPNISGVYQWISNPRPLFWGTRRFFTHKISRISAVISYFMSKSGKKNWYSNQKDKKKLKILTEKFHVFFHWCQKLKGRLTNKCQKSPTLFLNSFTILICSLRLFQINNTFDLDEKSLDTPILNR